MTISITSPGTTNDTNSFDGDVIIVGGGFGGTNCLWNLRKMGFNCRLIEKGYTFGGVWTWNHYPGARVDSDVPTFELSHPDLWNDWKWSERFPGQPEILRYFEYVNRKMDLEKDVSFGTTVNSAHWDESTKRWTVGSKEGTTFRARYLIWCTGYFTKRYVPDIPGLASFKGPCLHTGSWPSEGVNLSGKRVGIIGTGASAVQLIQDIAPLVKHLTVFQRTPNTALPMVQRKLPEGGHDKKTYQAAFHRLRETTSGFLYSPKDQSALDATPEEREAFFQSLYDIGGFAYYLGSYNDIMTSIESNHIAYDFWQRSVCKRVKDPKTAELLAPKVPLHSFGAKRPCLEQRYYEVYNQENVDLVDVRVDSIERVEETGVRTVSGLHELDVIVTATGYDAVIGGYKEIDIRGEGGKRLVQDGWANGCVYTTLGLSTNGFPNMFYVFGPQSPFANGPTACEIQSEYIIQILDHMRKEGLSSIESTSEADHAYKKLVNDAGTSMVIGIGAGWFWGANVPGERSEPQIFLAGIPAYKDLLVKETKAGYPSFKFT